MVLKMEVLMTVYPYSGRIDFEIGDGTIRSFCSANSIEEVCDKLAEEYERSILRAESYQ